MTQMDIDITTHMGFQLSLLKLATIPGTNGAPPSRELTQEASQIEALVDRLLPVRNN